MLCGGGVKEAQKWPSVGCWLYAALGILITDMEMSRTEAPLSLFVSVSLSSGGAFQHNCARVCLHTSRVSYGKLLLPSVCCHLVNIYSGLDRSSGHQIRLASLALSLIPGPDEE